MKSIDTRIQWQGWETVGLIGRGSFGAVYEIQRDVFGEVEKAALKVISIPQNSSDIDELYGEGYDEESITSTFKSHLKSIIAEYSLMRKMSDSVNIVNCEDVRYIQHEDGIGWDIFIKMELLTPLIKSLSGNITEETVVKLGVDMCRALEMCGEYDIVHRDIKPQNIFISSKGDYKLGDFGIAKTMEKTMCGTKIGTYKYMAPEVYNNQPYGAGADIYSLGLVLYWLLNERRMPFLPLPPEKLRTDMDEEARNRRFSGEAIPAPAHGSDALKAVVLKACAYNPADRFGSAQEMRLALEAALRGEGLDEAEQRRKEKEEQERLKREQEEQERLKLEREEKERLKREQEERERLKKEQEERDCIRREQEQQKPKKPNPWWIVITAFCLMVAVIFVCIFFGKDNKSASASVSSQTPTARPAASNTNNTNHSNNATAAATPKPAPTPLVLPEIQVGDYVTFGKYEQNGDSGLKEDIEWIVLDKDGDSILLISRYCLDAQPYEADGGNVTWGDSSLRSWLNGTFLDNAFSNSEKDMIISTTLTNGNNPVHGTEGGDNTEDYAFVLSISEAEFYCRNVSTQAASTQYAINRGVFSRDTSGYSWLWLRSPGKSGSKAAYIRSDGEYAYDGESVSNSAGGVRPCVWVDTSEYKNGSTALKKLDVVELKDARIGDRIYLGAYEQDDDRSNGKEAIEWTVLEKEGNRILVISSYCLDVQPYEKSGSSVTWANSSIREWLNSSFMETAFDDEEQRMILYTQCYNEDNPVHYTNGGVDTEDKVFLLSIEEVQKYMTSTHAMPTEYALEQGVLLNDYSRNSWWWLRTPGENSYTACCISSGAFYMYEGASVGRSDGGVRPAMWISVAE